MPGTSGFVGEFLILIGTFKVNSWVALLGATGVILGAAYMLYLYRRVIFGELIKDNLKDILDLNKRELIIFAPLVLLVIVMGVYPVIFLDVMHNSVEQLINRYNSALAAQDIFNSVSKF